MSNKTIYEKLQLSRVALAKAGLKKGGKNKFAGYEYFELTDFLTKSNELLLENRLTPSFNFVDDLATLTLFDWDSEETMEWSTNGADATTLNKSGQPSNLEIQTLGSKHTYLKRYLYMHMMEVAENDGLEANTENPETMPKSKTSKQKPVKQEEPIKQEEPKTYELITRDQEVEILDLFGERIEGLLAYCKVDKLRDLPSITAQQLIDKEKASRDKHKTEQINLSDL